MPLPRSDREYNSVDRIPDLPDSSRMNVFGQSCVSVAYCCEPLKLMCSELSLGIHLPKQVKPPRALK